MRADNRLVVSVPALRELLLTEEEAARLDAPGSTEAAVLVPLLARPYGLVAVFTERRGDLRRHAGEISFPGGRQDEPDEDLRLTALREAEEEIGLDPARVELVGALPPVGTFVTGYRVFPFVGLIEPGHTWRPQATEVAQVLEFTLPDLVRGHEMQRLLRKGVPIKTPTYTVDGHLVWGATARIVESLLERLAPLLRGQTP
jgi:8-oxo-dGTP pyrophosphatase MutT (NUDIX family)